MNAPEAQNWQLATNWPLSSLSTLGAIDTKTYENWTLGHWEGKTPFEEMVSAYVEYQRNRGLRAWRKIAYELAVYGRWLDGGGLEVSDMGPRLAEEYQGWLTTLEGISGPHYTSRSVAAMVCTTEGLHRWLTDSGVCDLNPFHRMRRVKTDRPLPRTVPPATELTTQLETLSHFWKAPTLRQRKSQYRLHVMAEVLYATGMRLGELANLALSDIDWEAGTVRIREGKGGGTRLAWINEYAQKILSVYVNELRVLLVKDPSGPLFGVASGRALEGTINAGLRKHLGMTSHGLRHCLGTHLLSRGCDLRFIQLILGHEDLGSTSLYTHVSKEDLRSQLDAHHPRGG